MDFATLCAHALRSDWPSGGELCRCAMFYPRHYGKRAVECAEYEFAVDRAAADVISEGQYTE